MYTLATIRSLTNILNCNYNNNTYKTKINFNNNKRQNIFNLNNNNTNQT